MNTPLLELALKKQRLQLRSAALRDELGAHARGLMPLCAAGDNVRAGAHWLRGHPQVVVAAGVALLVARPRTLFRWARRSVVAWQAWERLNAWLDARKTSHGTR